MTIVSRMNPLEAETQTAFSFLSLSFMGDPDNAAATGSIDRTPLRCLLKRAIVQTYLLITGSGLLLFQVNGDLNKGKITHAFFLGGGHRPHRILGKHILKLRNNE